MAGGRLKPCSQYGEDQILPGMFGDKHGGFAVDIGAADGYHHSNVYRLVNEFGWKALLVEPHPVFAAEARKQYAGKPVAVTEKAVKATGDTCVLHCYEPSYYGQVSTTVEEFRAQVVQQHGDQYTNDVTVACATSEKILNDAGVSEVDFLNVDCEGAEVDVLSTWPWGRIRPAVVCIEMAMNVEEIDRIMTANGYEINPVGRYGGNAFYVPRV